MMKSNYLVILIIAAGVLFVSGWFLTHQNTLLKNNPLTYTATVLMKEDSFEPENLTIKKGATITFKNLDKAARWPASNLHPTHSIYPEFDPQQPIAQNNSWSFTFDKAGSFKYHDHLIPSIKGIIIVTD